MKWRLGIGLRLALLALAAALPVLLILAYTYTQWFDARVGGLVGERRSVARLTSSSLESLVSDMSRALQTAGHSAFVEHENVTEKLRVLTGEYPARYALLTDTTGKVVASSETGLVGRRLDSSPAVAAVLAGKRVAAGPLTTLGGRKGFDLAGAVTGERGRRIGVGVVFVDASALQKTLAVQGVPGQVNVVDAQGQLVIPQVEASAAPASWAGQPFVKDALAGKEAATARAFVTPGGRPLVLAEVPVRSIGWAAGSSIDFETAAAPVVRARNLSAAIALPFLLVAVAISYYLGRDIARSLTDVASSADAIGRGELDATVSETSRNDEVGDVARSLDETRTSLDGYIEALAGLSRASATLATSLEPPEVQRALSDAARELFDADVTGVFLLDEPTGMLTTVMWSGEGSEAHQAPIAPGEGVIGDVFRDLRPHIVGSIDEDAELRSGGRDAHSGPRALAVLPLVTTRPLGVLCISAPSGPEWTAGSKRADLLTAFASQVAVTVDNMRLLEQKTLSEQQMRESREQLKAVVKNSPAVMYMKDLDGGLLMANDEYARVFSRSEQDVLGQSDYGLLPPKAAAEIRENDLRVIEGRHALQFEEHLPEDGHERTFLSVKFPLIDDTGRVYALAGVATDITDRKRAERLRMALEDVNRAIHATLDFDDIMQVVVVTATEAIGADSGRVSSCENGLWVTRYGHGLAPECYKRTFEDAEAPDLSAASRGNTVVAIDDAAAEDRYAGVLNRNETRASLVAPIAIMGEPGGVIEFAHAEPHSWEDAEVEFATSVASSLSLALANSRLYQTEHDVAEKLQEAILTVPEAVHGISFGRLYRSATAAARVGGDFFDIFELKDGRVGVVVGDVSGKGLGAAALASTAKNVTRAYAYELMDPGEAMCRVNELIVREIPSSMFITIVLAVLAPESGTLEYCNAGHTPPLVRRASGVDVLEEHGRIVGITGGSYRTAEVSFGREDVLLLYTDGITEARRGKELYGDERLVECLGRTVGIPAPRLPRTVFQDVLEFTSGHLSDDVAMLAVAIAP